MFALPQFQVRHIADNTVQANEVHEQHWTRNYIAFWFIGMINNYFFCIVLDAADHIAESFNAKSYVALISWANTIMGLFLKVLNAFIFTKVAYNKRFALTAVQSGVGLFIVSIAKYCGGEDENAFRFFIALLGITFIGNASAYGESVCLGYLERFPSKMVGAWSAGTGMSGVASAILYLLFTRAMGFSNTEAFWASAPWLLVYCLCYFKLIVAPVSLESKNLSQNIKDAVVATNGHSSQPGPTTVGVSSTNLSGRELVTAQNLQDDVSPAVDDSADRQDLVGHNNSTRTTDNDVKVFGSNWALGHWDSITPLVEDENSNKPLMRRFNEWKMTKFPRVKKIHRAVLWYNINLMLVYIAEYSAQFMAPFAFPCVAQKHSEKFLLKNGYVLTQFAYQTGVLCSRSSLSCVKIRRVHFLSIIQWINAIGWIIQAKTLFLSSHYDGTDQDYSGSSAETSEEWFVALLLAWMFFVGLLGGAAYVNVFYNILETDMLTKIDGLEDGYDDVDGTNTTEKSSLVDAGVTYQSSGTSAGANGDTVNISSSRNPPSDEDAKKAKADRAREDRELAVNLGAIWAVIGITVGSILDLIFANTLVSSNAKC